MFEQLGLIGCGLMGGSFALALKRGALVQRVVGYSKSASTTDQALHLGVIDAIAESAPQAVAGSDIVLLADLKDANTGKIAAGPGINGPLLYVPSALDSAAAQWAEWCKAVGDPKKASAGLRRAMISRLPKRSDTAPVTSTSSSDGANWIMPTRPRSNGSRVRS